MTDILADAGHVFLGSRLKRLGERMQAGAAVVLANAGLPVQPTHMPLLAALHIKPMTVGQLAEAIGASQPGITRGIGQLAQLGLVETVAADDQRRRALALTEAGRAAMARAHRLVWPRLQGAVTELCAQASGSLLEQIATLEAALAKTPLAERAGAIEPAALTIHAFTDALAADFHAINAEWIGAMFTLEATDREVLENPRARIIDPGGAILFVEAPGLGIIGTCALQRTGGTAIELTKMGVRPAARGLKAGEFLLAAVLERAQAMGADPLYLLTNARCAAAIHLYEKLGFRHDPQIMRDYGARYARCDVAMRWHVR